MNQLIAPWRNLWRAALYFYDDLFLWLGLSILQGLALVTIILAPPVAMGINAVGNERAREKRINFDLFKDGFRTYFWSSYKYLLIWVAVAALLGANMYFYADRLQGWLRYLTFLWFYLALFWVSILPYLFPIFLETETPTILIVYRNTMLLALSKPLYTLFLLLQIAILVLLTRYIPILLFIIFPAMTVLMGNLGARYLIDAAKGVDTADDEE